MIIVWKNALCLLKTVLDSWKLKDIPTLSQLIKYIKQDKDEGEAKSSL